MVLVHVHTPLHDLPADRTGDWPRVARTDRPPRIVILGAGATGLGTGLGLALHGYEGRSC